MTDSKAVPTFSQTTTSKADVGGPVTLTVDASGQLNGGLVTTSDKSQDITINRAVGKIDAIKGTLFVAGNVSIEAASQKSLDTQTTTFNDVSGVGVLSTFTDVNNVNTDTGGNVAFNLGATGSIAGTTTIRTGGDLSATINGRLGSSTTGTVALSADLTMGDSLATETAVDTTTTTKFVFDPTGTFPVSLQVVTANADTGGGAILRVGSTGVVTGSVTIVSNQAQNIILNGISAGANAATGTWTLIGAASNNSKSNTALFDAKDGHITSSVQTANITDTGAPIIFTEGLTGKLSAPLVIATGGDVSVTNNGSIGLGTVSTTALNINTTAGFGINGTATDRITTLTQTFDSNGNVLTQTSTDIQSKTGGTATVMNGSTGTLTGDVFVTSDKPIAFTNMGAITGNVTLGTGADVLDLYTGSSISGAIDGQGGGDAIHLLSTGAGTLGGVTNVATLNVDSGTWALTGTETYSGGVTMSGGATASISGAGSIVTSAGETLVGVHSGPGAGAVVGSLIVNGGGKLLDAALTVGDSAAGDKALAVGTVSLSGLGSSITTSGFLVVGGLEGLGVFKQTGGSNSAGELVLGNLLAGTGTYNLSGSGALTVTSLDAGLDGSVVLGSAAGSTGTFNYNTTAGDAATIAFTGVGQKMVVGDAGTGTFNQGGDLTWLFWTKRFDRICLGKELGHAEEEVQRGADRYSASPD